MSKICPHCNSNLPTSSYFKRIRDGKIQLQSWCKECQHSNYARWKKSNRQYWSQWQKENKDKCDKTNKSYRERHREELKHKTKEWCDNNPWYHRYWNTTDKGKRNKRKSDAKRRRDLHYIEIMDNPFPPEIEVDYHHINDILVIPLPRIIHQKYPIPQHREILNKEILSLYGLDVSIFIEEMKE